MTVKAATSVAKLKYNDDISYSPITVLPLPAFVFIRVWNRMRKASRDGRLRPLGLGIGIILFFLTRIPPLVLGLGGLDIGYGLVFVAYLVIWLSMTSRMDRIFVSKQIRL